MNLKMTYRILAVVTVVLMLSASVFVPSSYAVIPSTSSHSRSSNVAVIPYYNWGIAGVLPESDLNALAASPPAGIPPGPGFTFTDVNPSAVSSAADLAPFDTLIFWQFNPGPHGPPPIPSGAFRTAVLDWLVSTGGKILVWDSDTMGAYQPPPYHGGPADYSWLSSVGADFIAIGPGSMGYYGGTLTVVEETYFASANSVSPYYIDSASLASETDAVGDENVMVTHSPSWCALQTGFNYLGQGGFVTAYTKPGSLSGSSAIIVYSGLDTDWVSVGSGYEMTKMLFFELIHGWGPLGSPEVSDLKCQVPILRLVAIDIKPGSFPNSINPKSKGTIPVAILSEPGFDAPSMVDRSSLTFGKTGSELSLAFCSPTAEDVNGDGLLDLVCHFNTQNTGFSSGDTVGILKGQLIDRHTIMGSDSVSIVR